VRRFLLGAVLALWGGVAAAQTAVPGGNPYFVTMSTAGNATVGGALSALQLNGTALNGTFTGAPTFSGNLNFTGSPLFSGNPIFSGNVTYSGTLAISSLSLGGALTAGGIATLNSGARAMSGSAATPGFSFTGDTTTGFYLPSSGALGFSSGGSSVADYGATNAGKWTFAQPMVLAGSGTGLSVANNATVGTLTLTGSQSQAQFLASPSGGSGAPAFRSMASSDVTGALGFTPQTNALASAQILVGNGSGVAASVAPSGDVSMSNAGAFTVGNLSSVTNGSLANTGLAHSGLTLGSTGLTLGATTTSVAGLTLNGPTVSGGTIDNTVLGGVTPAAASVTTLSASGAVSGAGFSTYLASPPAIGGTTAAAGAFTNLASSGTVTGPGFSTYLASPPAIGSIAPGTGAFTSLSANGAASFTGSGTGLSVTNNALISGVGTFGPSAGNQLTITGGAASTNPVVLGQTGTGGISLGPVVTFVGGIAGTTSGNIFQANSINTYGNTITLSGTTIPTYMGNFIANWAGSSTRSDNTGVAAFHIGTSSDNANFSVNGGTRDELLITGAYGGASFNGFRLGAQIQMLFNTASTLTNVSGGGSGLNTKVVPSANFGGSSGNYLGSFFGMNPWADCKTGFTFGSQCVGTEIDAALQTGASASNFTVLQNVITSDHATHGIFADVGVALVAQLNAAAGVRNAKLSGRIRLNGRWIQMVIFTKRLPA
jgi:hypothetical protein